MTKEYRTLDELPLFLTMKDLASVLRLSEPKAREIARSDGFPLMDRKLTGKRMIVPKMPFLEWAKKNYVEDYISKEV